MHHRSFPTPTFTPTLDDLAREIRRQDGEWAAVRAALLEFGEFTVRGELPEIEVPTFAPITPPYRALRA